MNIILIDEVQPIIFREVSIDELAGACNGPVGNFPVQSGQNNYLQGDDVAIVAMF